MCALFLLFVESPQNMSLFSLIWRSTLGLKVGLFALTLPIGAKGTLLADEDVGAVDFWGVPLVLCT